MALFRNTDLFSPIAKGYEGPMDNDLFFYKQEEIPFKETLYEKFLKSNAIEIDDEFWFEQDRRCREGYEVEDALVKGGDAIVDGRDAIWNDTAKPWDYYNDNFDKRLIIPPETVYLADADLLCPQATVRITGRHYFYLNFWKILSERGIKGEGKDFYNPIFTDIDFLKAYRIALQIEMGKDNSEGKARQLGYSKSSSGMILGYNMLFVRSSVNVIVAGNDEDSKELFETTYDGIRRLTNTQFYKVIDKDAKSDQKLTTKYFNSKLYGFTAGAKNEQVLSRLTPYWVIYEEVGKWSKGLVQRVQDFVEPSIITRGNRTGYQTFIGCVCKGTKVYQANGEIVNVEDLNVNKGILGYAIGGEYKDTIVHYNPPQKKQCYRITTVMGRIIECSYDHPFFMTNTKQHYTKRKYVNGKRINISRSKRLEWKEAKDLKKGDQLTLIANFNTFGNIDMWEPRLVGMLIGDGSYGYNKTPVMSNEDIEINNYIESRYDTVLEKSYTTKLNRVYKETRIRNITKNLRELGIYGQTKSAKRLPDNLHLYSKDSLIEMIAGLYDTDGTIVETNVFGNLSYTINISQSSRELLVQLQSLLLKFGIQSNLMKASNSRIKEHYIKSKNDYWSLNISSDLGLIRFAKNFKLLIKRKQKFLDYILDSVIEKYKYETPVEVITEKGKAGIILNHEDLLLDSIKSIEDIGMQDVYNLTTNDSHTYLANDFITHNTGGDMEMGADDMEKIHYSTSDQYLRFKNKFERQDVKGKSGWFSPKWWFTIVDEYGNSNKAKGIEYVKKKIDEEKDVVKRYIKMTQWALYAQDAFQMSVAGFFGETKINMLNARLSEIKLHKELQLERYGILEWKDPSNYFKGVNFIETDQEEAFVVIIEEPMKDKDGNDILNLYEIGIDSYDMDESQTSDSKGSAVVRKKMIDNNSLYDSDVAMILERPKANKGGASKFFEHCAMLSIYFNKSMMTIEYTKIRIFDWLELNGFGSLIALRPVIAFANVMQKSQASNRYGIDGSMKPHIMAMLSDKLTEEFISRMFLTEQIKAFIKYKYSRNYNCDITVASAHANVAAKESELIVPKSENNKKDKTVKHSYYVYKNGGMQRVFI